MYPNLRIQLWKAGIRQNRLAKMLDMDETLLSRIVNGYREPNAEFRKKISAILESDEVCLFQADLVALQNRRDFLAKLGVRLPVSVDDSAKQCLIHIEHLG